jgi:hypothetical protein
VDGKREGKGTAVLSDGSRYIGTQPSYPSYTLVTLFFPLSCFIFYCSLI